VSAGYTNIAFLKDDALVQPAKDLLLNPGGPGGSGVNYVRNGRAKLRDMFGPLYNIIGFDPRAVNNSGPHLDYYQCMGKPLEEMNSLKQEWCRASLANGDAKYTGTVAVAQDLLNFIELRNEELGNPGKEAKLSFYGASYGTVVGTTFAAIYPDRIKRMILDAVVDGVTYYNGEGDFLASDSLDILSHFAPMCLAAGPQRCVFHGGSKTATKIEARIEAIFKRLAEQSILPSGLELPFVMDTIDLSYVMFMAAYRPLVSFPTLAEALVELEAGEGRKLLELQLKYSQLLEDQAGDQGQGAMIQCLDPAFVRSRKRLGSRKDIMPFIPIQDMMPFIPIQDMLRGQENTCLNRNIVPPPSQQFVGKFIAACGWSKLMRTRVCPDADKLSHLVHGHVSRSSNADTRVSSAASDLVFC
jgi:pimeloyl-ACP methyl ester carboxylesterase